MEYTVVSDPADGSNQVLQFVAGLQSGAYRALDESAVPDGESGTLFARFRFDQTGNANFGFSDVPAPAVYNDFEAQINRQNGTVLKARDGTGFLDFAPIVDGVDVWYKLWLVADNESDSSRVYVQSDEDPTYAAQTELSVPDGTMNFRFGTSEALATLMLRSQEGTAFWDDFYVSPGTDLSEPPHRVLGEAFQVTEFYYFLGLSAELTWSAVPGHEYAIDKSGDLTAWTATAETVVATGDSAGVELFDDDISTESGRLYYRVRDLGVAAGL